MIANTNKFSLSSFEMIYKMVVLTIKCVRDLFFK